MYKRHDVLLQRASDSAQASCQVTGTKFGCTPSLVSYAWDDPTTRIAVGLRLVLHSVNPTFVTTVEVMLMHLLLPMGSAATKPKDVFHGMPQSMPSYIGH